jgi:acyl carrier protein
MMTGETDDGVLRMEDFLTLVKASLQLPTVPSSSARLYEDLALDSLAMYELLVAVEEFGGEVSEELWLQAVTLTDCYKAYRAAASK